MNRMLLDLYRGARELSVPDFQESAFLLLKSVLRFDSGIWGAGDVTSDAGLVIHTLHLHEQPEEWVDSYEQFKSHDRAAFEVDNRLGEVCKFHFPDIDTGPLNEANRLHCKKFATQNALITSSIAQDISSQDFMALFRAQPRDRYSDDERRRAEFLLPHLIEAGRINRVLWLNKMSALTEQRRGARAIVGLGGMLYSYDEAFENMVRMEWPEWMPPVLPLQLLAALQSTAALRFKGNHIAVGASASGDMLFLQVRRRLPVDTLAPVERNVATLVAHGHPYKEVARNMGVSVATVRNQLHNVYRKLGVRNKAELAQCLGNDLA